MRYQWRYINRNQLVVKDKKHVLTDPGITHILSNHTLKPLRTPPVAIGLHLSIKIQPSNTALEKHPGIIMSDMIYLRNLHLNAVIGPDRWHRSGRSQPVILSIQLKYDLLKAAAKDDVAKTLNYGTLCQEVIEFFIDNTGTWVLHEFAFQVCRLLMDWMFKVTRAEQERRVRVEILLPKGALRVEGGLGVELLMTGTNVDSQFLTVKELKVPCIIGVNSHERVEKQTVVIDLKMNDVSEEDLEWNGQPIVKAVTEVSRPKYDAQ